MDTFCPSYQEIKCIEHITVCFIVEIGYLYIKIMVVSNYLGHIIQ
jgi:hypothetical protein